MKKIFVVDDNDASLTATQYALVGAYDVYPVKSTAKMFNLLSRITPDLILLDVNMPLTDGFEALQILKQDDKMKLIPVLLMTATPDETSELRGFELGIHDFIIKPFSIPVLKKRIDRHIETDQTIKKSRQAVHSLANAIVRVISNMVESRDKVTDGHIERTQYYLKILVGELVRRGTYAAEMEEWDLGLILPSAQLHDVGKITISDLILSKPAKLTAEEFERIKIHCDEGERIIDLICNEAIDDGFLYHARRFAGYHHEKWDGTGYPRQLLGEAIPLEGRIMAVVDVYDALVSERPYKTPLTHKQAVEIIKDESGKHFDPQIVEAFLGIADIFYVFNSSIDTLTEAFTFAL